MTEERRYFIMVPNMVDDMDISAQAFRLYCHIRRVAGEDGRCWESTRTLAGRCNLSRHSVMGGIKTLESAGLITVHRFGRSASGAPCRFRQILRVVDIWEENMSRYNSASSDDGSGAARTRLARTGTKWSKFEPDGSNSRRKKNTIKKNGNKREPVKKMDHVPENDADLPLAVIAVQAVSGVRVTPLLHNRLVSSLGDDPDIERLQECFMAWIERGYRPLNMAWALEWYPGGIPGRKEFKLVGSETVQDQTHQALQDYLRLNPHGLPADALQADLPQNSHVEKGEPPEAGEDLVDSNERQQQD